MKNPLIYLISTVWKYAGTDRKLLVFTYISFVISICCNLFEPFFIGIFFNALQNGKINDVYTLGVYLGIYFSILVPFYFFHYPARVAEVLIAFRIRGRIKEKLFAVLNELPLKWHSNRLSGDIIDKVNKASDSLHSFSAGVFQIIYDTIRLFGSIIALLLFTPYIGILALFVTTVAISSALLYDRYLIKNIKSINLYENKVTGVLFDYLSNIVTVIILRLSNQVKNEVNKNVYAHFNLYKKTQILNEIKWASATLLIAIMTTSALFLQGYMDIRSGTVIQVGTFYTLFEYLKRISISYYQFNWKYADIVRQHVDVVSIESILKDYDSLGTQTKLQPIKSDFKKIEISSLFFSYEDDKHKIHHICDINLLLERGKKYAFVGESGSGKSTLLKLIRGVQDPEKSALKIDGENYPDGIKVLSNIATLIPQDPELFSDTVRFNVSFGINPDETDDLILKAIDLAQFKQVIDRLPNGLDTNISEKGVNLSGGERQRLALARGIYFASESQIILLDEPTSSVDVFNERLIYQRLLSTFNDHIIVSSIHKLHLLNLFDYIYFFSDGKLLEEGNFSTLVKMNGKFKKMLDNYSYETDGL